MTERTNPFTKKTSVEEVRENLLRLADEMVDKARQATTALEAQAYAGAASDAFSAATARMEDVPPDGG
jgi:hypothetical protein